MATLYYRTTFRPTDYGFDFEPQADGSWRIYVVSQPSYGSRPSDMNSAHWLSDGGRRYVCWSQPIRTFTAAKTVAAEWADRTQRYIANGTPIEAPWP